MTYNPAKLLALLGTLAVLLIIIGLLCWATLDPTGYQRAQNPPGSPTIEVYRGE